jgi:hypothetical protein
MLFFKLQKTEFVKTLTLLKASITVLEASTLNVFIFNNFFFTKLKFVVFFFFSNSFYFAIRNWVTIYGTA